MIEVKNINNLVFMGLFGVGKGIVVLIIVKEYGLVYLLIGNIFRVEIVLVSELGKKIFLIVELGGYVFDDIINEIVVKVLENYNKFGKIVILDGYLCIFM